MSLTQTETPGCRRSRWPIKELIADRKIGQRVRLARLQRGWRQRDLAEAIKVKTDQVSRYEMGVDRIASSRLMTIAQQVGKPPGWFFLDAS